MKKTMKNPFFWIGFTLHLLTAQTLLFDDVHSWEANHFTHFIDTLREHGVNVCFSSLEGFENLQHIDVIWFASPYPTRITNISNNEFIQLQQFIRSGKPVILNVNMDYLLGNINQFLEDLTNADLIEYESGDTTPPVFVTPIDNLGCVLSTDDSFWFPNNIHIRIISSHNCFPLFSRNDTLYAVICYPFMDSTDNCGSPLFLFANIHTIENQMIEDYPEQISSSLHIFKKLLLSLLGKDSCVFLPCTIPGNSNSVYNMENSSCLSLPSPFTPNGDGINDFCQFSFPEMMFSPATIRIYDIHSVLVKDIQVPLGWAAKSAARWYGKDNSGKPVPQGVYLYEIEQNGEIICTGTVTVAR